MFVFLPPLPHANAAHGGKVPNLELSCEIKSFTILVLKAFSGFSPN